MACTIKRVEGDLVKISYIGLGQAYQNKSDMERGEGWGVIFGVITLIGGVGPSYLALIITFIFT